MMVNTRCSMFGCSCKKSQDDDRSLGIEQSARTAVGSVDVLSRAALLRQMSPGKARDEGNGYSLAKSRNAAWRHCRATRRVGPARPRTKRQQTLTTGPLFFHSSSCSIRQLGLQEEQKSIRDQS